MYVRFLALLLSTAALCLPLRAQQLATGERTPKIKAGRWIDGIEPAESEYTYIEFVHSKSWSCLESALKIKRHVDRTDRPFRVVFITSEDENAVDNRLRGCSGGYVGTLSDPSGRIFRDFGVRYVPFGVIVDLRRKAVWFGNPLTADSDFFEKIISEQE